MFRDRADAGAQLARGLDGYDRPDPLVLALPRGGLPVALPVALRLSADLDVLVVRKLGAPGNPEYAMGAIGEDGIVVMDHDARRRLHITEDAVRVAIAREQDEIDRRVDAYRGGSHRLGLAGRNVIIVDDGLATGSTAAAAVRVARHMGAEHITLAVPVGSVEAVQWLSGMADDLICLQIPEPFWAVGQHYREFPQVSDDEVVSILRSHPRRDPRAETDLRVIADEVTIDAQGLPLTGNLTIPVDAVGLVVFVHGTGSNRTSPRNLAVAASLQASGLGTLLFDLLTPAEAHASIDLPIPQAARRVLAVIAWLRTRPEARGLPIGVYGASSGAAAALAAAAEDPRSIRAVVSRGGRPDLASPWLGRVQAPTLLIVGSLDYAVLDLNSEAQRHLTCDNHLHVVRGASHLFEEQGTLQQAASAARAWFLRHLGGEGRVTHGRQAS